MSKAYRYISWFIRLQSPHIRTHGQSNKKKQKLQSVIIITYWRTVVDYMLFMLVLMVKSWAEMPLEHTAWANEVTNE